MQRLGVEGRLVTSFTMAGGIMFSGVLMSAVALTGHTSGIAVLSTTLILFVIGTILGWVHAVILGCAGHEEGCDARHVTRRIITGGILSLPGLVIAFLAALGIAFSPVEIRFGGVPGIAAAAVSWLSALIIGGWALLVGLEAFRNVVARYVEVRLGSSLLIAVLLALLVIFQRTRPEIWFTDYRVNAVGAVLLACAATLWIGAPVLLSVLHLLYRYMALRPQRAIH